jgi:hypothetical protein
LRAAPEPVGDIQWWQRGRRIALQRVTATPAPSQAD